uniref:AAA+ ATPase domain-containing protein n=1 Tax=Prasinoderma singulare TaxID=676789 RepID=A0A7S3FAF0_9VIRI|mmetsp:Transcript_17700/g.54969  ORF Transcript_17700/g.54969 Transcript_17700/m.54969 type:complete len:344 (+) Transcript_17700:156-1187(+)
MAEASAPPAKRARTAEQDSAAPWVEKYRPKTLGDVAAHQDIIETIQRLTAEDRLPHLMLYGPPGTGKTSTILAVARQLYGSSYQNMTLELNASDDRKIDVVRNQIQDFASTKRIFSKGFKLIILDEADAMSKDAQFALRRGIEKYTRNTRFCLICNQVSRIIPALQSRCTRFRFAPLPSALVRERLTEICAAEGAEHDEGGIAAVEKVSGGDMRKALNVLQAAALATQGGAIDAAAVYSCTGNPLPSDVEGAVQTLLNDKMSQAFAALQTLKADKGLALADIVREVHAHVWTLSLPGDVRADLVIALADIEHALAAGASDKMQLGALCGAFVKARSAVVAARQ